LERVSGDSTSCWFTVEVLCDTILGGSLLCCVSGVGGGGGLRIGGTRPTMITSSSDMIGNDDEFDKFMFIL
jgi:hypothetical protein